jgi:hypothetical protein
MEVKSINICRISGSMATTKGAFFSVKKKIIACIWKFLIFHLILPLV